MDSVFRERLRAEIRASGMTLKELGEEVGVSAEMLTQYYTTKKLPRLDTFVRLCSALEVSPDYLLGFDD